ncbi:MAG TPA: Uma2 family endonuclease [Planctomycetota bacterium]|nr:Uma2 family endonuclease [Planctomycetota bacterium]
MTTVTTKLPRKRMSLAAFMARPECSGRIEELLDGELVVSPTANERHSFISSKLAKQIDPQFEGLGRFYSNPLTVVLDESCTPAPDLCGIVNERLHIVRDGYPRGAPDFVIEILSPSNRRNDLIRKKRLYAAHGVREYWIVDGAAETVTRFWLRNGRYARGEVRHRSIRMRILPQIAVDLMAIWRPLRAGP